MKIAMIGSRRYENRRKIQDAIFRLKERFGDELIIISGGAKDGADKYVRKYAIDFGVTYHEYNPAHTTMNLYSQMPKHYYGKPYHVSQFHHRNGLIAKACDKMIAFISKGDKADGTKSAINQALKLDKKVTIIT